MRSLYIIFFSPFSKYHNTNTHTQNDAEKIACLCCVWNGAEAAIEDGTRMIMAIFMLLSLALCFELGDEKILPAQYP